MTLPESYRKFANRVGMDTKDDHSRCKNMIMDLGHCFSKNLRSETLNAYADALLENHTLSELYTATKSLKKTSRFFPTISDILIACPRTLTQPKKPLEDCGICNGVGVKHRMVNGYECAFRCRCANGSQKFSGLPLDIYEN